MFDRLAWNRAYNKERYEYYKARGICTQCGAAMAVIGRICCAECAEKVNERHNRHSAERAVKDKEQRRIWRENGKCTACGKRKPRPGLLTCKKCAQSQRERDATRAVKKKMERARLEGKFYGQA